MVKSKTPIRDTGLGLIFRLNDLWRDVERHAPKGEYEKWNFKLDRIYCNLLYRDDFEIEETEGVVVKIELKAEDKKVKEFLDKNILEAKRKMNNTPKAEDGKPKKPDYLKAKKEYYQAIMMKDIWLRKFMNELGLYIKEVEYDPSKAIYGGS